MKTVSTSIVSRNVITREDVATRRRLSFVYRFHDGSEELIVVSRGTPTGPILGW